MGIQKEKAMNKLIIFVFWFLWAWLIVSLMSCTTIVVQPPVVTPAPTPRLWPAPKVGCPAYRIVVNSQVTGNAFDPHDNADMEALKAVIVGCSGQYGVRSECLITLIKLDVGRYHAICGEKR